MKKSGKASLYLKWLARVVGGLTLLMFTIFVVGEGLPAFSTLSSVEMNMFIFLTVALIGILISWRWSFIGCLLILAGYVGFVIVDKHFTIATPFLLFPVIVVFYILACFFDSAKGGT